MTKNILITGGAGYIGSHTAQAFIDQGYKVVILDNLSTGFLEAVPKEAHFIQGDIHDVEKVTEILIKDKIDGVIHFAAKIIVPESIAHPIDYYANNTVGVLNMVEACKRAGVLKFVFSSTAAVYGDTHESFVKESTQSAPMNPYGSSKLFSESIIKDAEIPYKIRSVILRYFNVAGAASNNSNGQRSKNATHLIKLACEAALGKRSSLNVTGIDYNTKDGTGVRDYIHVEDLADIHVLAFNYLDAGGKSELLNCGYGVGHSVRDVIDAVSEVSGKKLNTIDSQRRPGDAAMLVADNEKIKRVLKWNPKRASLLYICRTAYLWESRLN
jgi:UDP-glucose 4-epimerase